VSPISGIRREGARSLSCAGAWTGTGDPLPATTIRMSGDRIASLEPCRGRTPRGFAIPSFVDAHCHLSWIGLQRMTLDLAGAGSASGMLDMVAAAERILPPGEILRAEKLDESTWEQPVLPGLAELDAAAAGRPAIVRRVCGHLVMVSSAAMEGLPAGCPGLDRDTGIIREGAALDMDALFPPSEVLLRDALDAAGSAALSLGITAVQTMEPWVVMEALAARPCGVRVSAAVFHRDAPLLAAARRGGGSPWNTPSGGGPHLTLAGLKIFLDGALGAATAAVDGTYADGSRGATLYDREGLAEAFREAAALGLSPLVHAIGAEALRLLDSVSSGLAASDPGILRRGVRVEHAEELAPAWPGAWDPAVHRFSMQPNFVSRWQGPGGMYHGRLGAERADRLNPFGLVSRGGFALGFGSDGMPFGPLEGLPGATAHPVPEYRLGVGEALRAYTLGAASISGLDDLAVALRPGRTADLTVLDGDPFALPWSEIGILGTIRNGRVVFGPPDLLAEEEP